MLGVCMACMQHIRNADIRTRCHVRPIIDPELRQNRLHWFGHVVRMGDDCVALCQAVMLGKLL